MAKPVYIVVTPFFPSPALWRGPFCLDFVKALERTGKYDVKVLVPGSGRDYEIEGVKVHRFPTKQLPSNILPFLFRRYNERSFLNKLREVLNPLSTSTSSLDLFSQVAICHGHTAQCVIYPLAIKRLNSACQALLHHHDPQSFGLNLGALRHCCIYNAWLFCRMRKLFEQIDCHVFISEMVKRSFLSAPDASWTQYENYHRQMRGPAFFHCRPVRIKRSLILHNGVDTSIFKEEGRRKKEEVWTDSHPFVIGCIGNFIDWKDQATLIRAVGLLSEKQSALHLHPPSSVDGVAAKEDPSTPIKVIFVGSGPTLEPCKRLAAETESKVNNSTVGLGLSPWPKLTFDFQSEVSHSQLAAFYHSLNLFVLPSYFEGFGCVFTEAWSCGVPFITCEGQGMDDLIPPEARSTWLCKPGSAEDLADKIADYFKNRPRQGLSGPADIDTLVGAFARELA